MKLFGALLLWLSRVVCIRNEAPAEQAHMRPLEPLQCPSRQVNEPSAVAHRFGPYRICWTKPMAMTDPRMTKADVK